MKKFLKTYSDPMPNQIAFSPDYNAFATQYEASKSQVVFTTLVADLETPVSAMLKIGSGSKYSFLLESVEGGSV